MKTLRTQRGSTTLVKIGVILLLVIAACVAIRAVFGFVDSHWETSAGVAKGTNDTTALYAKRDNKALRDAIAGKRAAETRVAVLEAEAAGKITAADAAYQQELKNGQAKVDAAVASVRAGYRLRDPGGSAGAAAGAGAASAAAGDPSQRDGAAGSKLPGATGCTLSEERSEFLVRLAGEADDVTKQLSACQVALRAMHEFALKLSYTLSGAGGAPPLDQQQ